jgi:hypothetical protein
MFKGIFGKSSKTQESYVPPSVPSLPPAVPGFESASVSDAALSHVDQPKSGSSSSAFGFISSHEAPESNVSSSSAFGFISSSPAHASPQQAPPAAVVQNSASSSISHPSASGFSFIHDDSSARVQSPASSSGFSFIQAAPDVASSSAEVDSKILEENMRVAGLKKAVKKRSMARRPGQASHDDDDPPSNSSQKASQPAVVDAAKPPAAEPRVNEVPPPVVQSALRSHPEHPPSEEPAFAFMTVSATPDTLTQPPPAPPSAALIPGQLNVIPSIAADSDDENSDGGGLDLDGMIIHEVVPDLTPPPVHQLQPQNRSCPSALQEDWVEMRDDASGKMCVHFV